MIRNEAKRRLGLWAAMAWLAIAPAFAAEPAAIVEEVRAGKPSVAPLDLLELGTIVTLAEGDQVVLGYLSTCARELLAGPGRLTIGSGSSALEGASLLERHHADCEGQTGSGLVAGEGAALRLRGISAGEVPIRRLSHRLPVLLTRDPARIITIVPETGSGKLRLLQTSRGALDTRGLMPPLESGLWLVRRGDHAVRLEIPSDASDAIVPILERLVDF